MSKQRQISSDYKEFVTTAQELADGEVLDRSSPQWEECFTTHLVSLTKLYEVRYRGVKVVDPGYPVGKGKSGNGMLAFLIVALVIVSFVVGYAVSIELGGIFW